MIDPPMDNTQHDDEQAESEAMHRAVDDDAWEDRWLSDWDEAADASGILDDDD